MTTETETHWAISTDGTRIAYHVSGEGPPLVLVYGALSDRTYWRRLAPYLDGYTLYIVERRGHGESGDGPNYRSEYEVDDVAAVIEAIGETAFVFGHSAGALLSLMAARKAPERVRKLALYEPPLITGAGLRPRVAADLPQRITALVEAGQPEAAIELFFREGPRLAEEDIQRQKAGQLWAGLTPMAATAAKDAELANTFDLPQVADTSFTVPTLLLYGETSNDWIIEGVKLLATRLGNTTLVELKGQGHVAAFTAPELLAAETRRFFEAT